MRAMSRVMAILVFAVVGLVGTAQEGRLAAGGHPGSAADLKAVLRDLWSGHNFWLRNIALDNTTNNRKALDYAEKSVATNARQIAKRFRRSTAKRRRRSSLPSWSSILVRSKPTRKPQSPETRAGRMRPRPTMLRIRTRSPHSSVGSVAISRRIGCEVCSLRMELISLS